MAAGVTGTAQIDQAVKKFLAESRYTLQERPGVLKSHIRVETLPENFGPSVNIPKFNTVTTYALTEGVDMAQSQQITDTSMTLTPAEYGAQVILTDMNLMEARDDFFQVAGRILGDSFDRQQDQTLCDDCTNFSVQLGGAGTALFFGHVMAAHAGIVYNAPADATAGRGGEPGPDPIFAAFTPMTWHSALKGLSGAVQAVGIAGQATIPQPKDLVNEYNLAGVSIVTDINFNKNTSDDVDSLVASKEAWILVTLGDEMDAEQERDSSLRAWEVNIVGRWARGEYNDGWGRGMTFDSSAPTG